MMAWSMNATISIFHILETQLGLIQSTASILDVARLDVHPYDSWYFLK